MRRVAIYLPVFLNYSETFIYSLVTNLQNFEPVIFCRERKNSAQFPLAGVYSGPLVENKKSLAELLVREKIELIHAQFGTYGADIVALANSLKIPLITHFRGQDAYQLARNFWIRLGYRRLFRQGQLCLTVSSHMRDHLIRLGVAPERVRVFYGGIDLSKIHFELRNFIRKEKYTLLMCGRLTAKKGFVLGLEAVADLIAHGYNLELLIVGQGEEEVKLKKLADRLMLEGKAKFLGSLDYARIITQLKRADYLLAPYHTALNGDSEGIPNVLKEAMAIGLPVITTSHSGIPELVTDKGSGLVAVEGNKADFVEKLKSAIDNRLFWPEVVRQARQVVEAKFDLQKQNILLENIYTELINARS